jgi:glycosyltransferase involved in cell wall biosynthesis
LKKILFIVSEDWYFVSHRLNLAKFAIERGYEVSLLSNMGTHENFINSIGVKTIHWPIQRKSRNPLKELYVIYSLFKLVKQYKPNLIHAVAIKPIFYTVLSSMLTNLNGVVLAFGGLGFIFRSKKVVAKFLRFFIVFMFKRIVDNSNVRLIIQNKDDRSILKNLNIINYKRIRLIRGVGIDLNEYIPAHKRNDIPLVILPARMLWDKGVGDFVNCARLCAKNNINARFALIGEPDIHNPESIPESKIQEWVDLGFVEYWGRQENMLKVYNKADIVCFPSYHEGLPKALLEAASCQLPIVCYNVPGCREIVINNKNGFVVPFKDENAMFSSIDKLLKDSILRTKMGFDGRQIVSEHFEEGRVISETIKVWDEIIL